MSTYLHQAQNMAQAVNMFNSNNNQNESDGWFVSYADILLLLLTFFVLLFAFSRVDGAGNNESVIDTAEKVMAISMQEDTPAEQLLAGVATKDLVQNLLPKPVSAAEAEIANITPVIGEGGISIVHELIAEADDIAGSDGILIDALFDEMTQAPTHPSQESVPESTIVAVAAPDRVKAVTHQNQPNIKAQEADLALEHAQQEMPPYNERARENKAVETGQLDKPNLLAQTNLVALTVDEQLAKLSAGLTSSEVEVSAGYQSIDIELNSKILFPVGQAQLLEEGQVFLDEIADIMKGNDYFASVEGHTDNTPIATTKFPSNWELSSSRATSVARYLISQGVSANRLRAIGYADTKPKVDNNSPENRARNRRVSITFHYDNDVPLSE